MEITENFYNKLPKEQAKNLAGILDSDIDAADKWQTISKQILDPSWPTDLQYQIYQYIYKNSHAAWQWLPSPDSECYLSRLMKQLGFSDIRRFHAWSVDHYGDFWQQIFLDLNLHYSTAPGDIVDISNGLENPIWLPGTQFNIIDSCLNGMKKTAIIVQKDHELKALSYLELKKQVNRISNSLLQSGIKPENRIAICMPMNKEACAIYLAIIQMGATVVSIADSFSSNEIKTRLDISETKLIFTQDVITRGNKAHSLYEKVRQAGAAKIICLAEKQDIQIRLRDCDLEWSSFLSDDDQFQSRPLPGDHPINILFSSGTTGTPKAIVWTQITAMKAASDARLYMDTHDQDIWCWPTNIGWMMGPWLIFACLINKAAIALYTDAPTSKNFIDFTRSAGVNKLGVIPSIVKTWRNSEVLTQSDLCHIDLFASTGEASNPEDYFYLSAKAGFKPIIEYCGGTEIGGAYISSTLIEPNQLSAFSTPAFGIDIKLLDEHGNLLTTSTMGEVALTTPAPGLSTMLINGDHHKIYYEGMPLYQGKTLRRHGDELIQLPNGYWRSLGRADDTMNLGGIKTSANEIETVVNRLDAVYESAAVAISPANGGASELILFIVPVNNNIDDNNLNQQIQKVIKDQLNPLFKVQKVIVIDKLPRTASNKVMRRQLRDKILNEKVKF
ncbi:MAG: AMP-binding protein [Francisellaceae bacterium]